MFLREDLLHFIPGSFVPGCHIATSPRDTAIAYLHITVFFLVTCKQQSNNSATLYSGSQHTPQAFLHCSIGMKYIHKTEGAQKQLQALAEPSAVSAIPSMLVTVQYVLVHGLFCIGYLLTPVGRSSILPLACPEG